MRALLPLVVLTGTAFADAKRECHFHNPKTKVTNLGCFDDFQATGDHTYGTRTCLVRAGTKCSGVMWIWEGDQEGTPVLLEEVTCRGASIEFFGTHDEGATIHLMNFTGRLAKRALRGSFRKGKEKKTVAWKQASAKETFDAAARIRAVTRETCAPGTEP
jgi:hypothetical protein